MSKWKYTAIQHGPRIAMGIDCNEYAVFDLIYKSQTHPDISFRGYTKQSYKELASYLNIGTGTVHGIVKRGIGWGLVEIHPSRKSLKRMTAKWYDAVERKVAEDDIEDVRETAARHREEAIEAADNVQLEVEFEEEVQILNDDTDVQILNDNVQILNDKDSDAERQRSDSERHLYIKEDKEVNEEKDKVASLVDRACEVIAFFNSYLGRKTKTHRAGKPVNAVDWIIKHLKKEFTVEEMTWAIMLKTMQWKDNPKMVQHLKLVTLFKNHGSEYIEEAIEASEDPKLQAIIKAAAAAESKSNSKAGIVAGDVTMKMASRLSRRTS